LATDKATLNGLINLRATQVSLFTEKTSLEGLINLRATQVSLGTLSGSLGTASTKDAGDQANNVVQLNASGQLPAVDGSNLTGISSAVEGSAVLSTGENATKYLRSDGDNSSSWQPLVVSDEELRGTTNPHIGAFPNQSFLVTDNPSKSVMLASDADGTLNVINSAGKFAIPVGLSVSEDSAEPDIEILSGSKYYSVITGDGDEKDPNGLPLRQGFNNPDIGAFSAPLLISGGSIV